MINIKSLFSNNLEVKAKPSTNEIIQEIHDTFYTEVDRLLNEAKISVSNETTKQELIDKCKRLKALGFTNTKEVQEAQIEINRLEEINKINLNKESLVRAINYFSIKYPNYKFITEDSVKKICEKYNLVYGTVNRYIGTIPDKNLKHIEEFKINENDICRFEIERSFHFGDGNPKFQCIQDQISSKEYNRTRRIQIGSSYIEYGTCPLEIAAPLKDFNMDKAEIKNFKISNIHIPDPVVLQPVIFKGQKHYLIVTAWGEESTDELVINNKMN